jgi:uncharacterized protein YcbX
MSMTDNTNARLEGIYRYPIKGLTAEPLASVELKPEQTLPFDRAYAFENGPGPFDPNAPKHLPKMHFVMLMRNEQLAAIRANFNDATQVLTLHHDGNEVARGDLTTAEGRATLEAAIARVVTTGLRAAPRLVASPGHSFSDVAAKCVHVINLESVRALETKMGATLDPLRFRPNLIIDGLPAWSELDMVGHKLFIGEAVLEIFKRTERCAATNVNPTTALRDQKIPSFLSRSYGHTDFGVYARVIEGGHITKGNGVTISEAASPQQ